MIIQNSSQFANKVQEIHTTTAGIITQSSDVIFSLNEGDNIFQLHPFFESMQFELHPDRHQDLAFPCVQLQINDTEAICDITIRMERGFLAILLFDYTTHYEHLHDSAQEKKTAMLNEQAHELNAKYSEDKKAYIEFIQGRIDSTIIRQLEEINTQLERLVKSDLSKEQSSIVNSITKNIASLRAKADKIKESLEVD